MEHIIGYDHTVNFRPVAGSRASCTPDWGQKVSSLTEYHPSCFLAYIQPRSLSMSFVIVSWWMSALENGTDPKMLYGKPVIRFGGPYEMIIVDMCLVC